jgi:acetone carboxylase gamma subunit
MSAPFSGSLEITDGKEGRSIACKGCGRALSAVGEPWKPAATVRERPMNGAGGSAYASAPHVVLRQFFCPGCGALLDTETAMADDPYLNDVIDA